MDTHPAMPPDQPFVSMAPRWISWVLASTVLPALPFAVLGFKSFDKGTPEFMVMLGFALLAQLGTSLLVAAGISQKRRLGIGGIIGLGLVFMIASVAVGSAVFFVACLSVASGMNFH